MMSEWYLQEALWSDFYWVVQSQTSNLAPVSSSFPIQHSDSALSLNSRLRISSCRLNFRKSFFLEEAQAAQKRGGVSILEVFKNHVDLALEDVD